MVDMLVKLYDLPNENISGMIPDKIEIKRALAPDKSTIVKWVKKVWGDKWASECDVSFANKPVSCFIALEEKKNIIGFACYEATCKNFFGPTGVDAKFRGKGIGKALLFKCLSSMREDGYGYAIIGGVGEEALKFYSQTVNAIPIEGSAPGIYKSMIGV